MQLRPLSEQVIVIVGASSGIGLVTALLAAERGSRVVIAARNKRDLELAAAEIRRLGGCAVHQVTDVADPQRVEQIAHTAVREFGRIDTWVNCAAVAMYGRLVDVSLEDMRRQFDVVFWGTVHGCRAAVPHLRANGGALINVASIVSDRAIPLQGVYCAAKHAVKAFTDALRMELAAAGAPISVSLVKPGSIDTPFYDNARTYLGFEPKPVPPVYAPEVAARAILECAERPRRDVDVGVMGKLMRVADAAAPRLTDLVMERTTFGAQMTDTPAADGRRDNLHAPLPHDGGERGTNWPGAVRERSLYTTASLHPRATALAAAGLGVALAAGVRALRAGNGAAGARPGNGLPDAAPGHAQPASPDHADGTGITP